MRGPVRIWRKAVDLFHGHATIEGHVDGLTAGEVSGWALDPAQPGRRVHVIVRAADQVVAEALADLPRADLLSAGKGDGRCGFRLRIPEDIDWASEVRVEAVNGRRRVLLTRGRLNRWARAQPEHQARSAPGGAGGFLETCHEGVVTGWAFDTTKSGTVKVDLFDGERFLGSAAATLQRSDLRRATAPDGAAGFRFELPHGVADEAADRLRARLASTRQDLRRSAGYPGRPRPPKVVRPSRHGRLVIVPSDGVAAANSASAIPVLAAGSASDWRRLADESAAVAFATSTDGGLLTAAGEALARIDPSMADVWVLAPGQEDADRARAEILIGRQPPLIILTGSGLQALADAVADTQGDPMRLIAMAARTPLIWRHVDIDPKCGPPPSRPASEWLPLLPEVGRVTLADADAPPGLELWGRNADLFTAHPDIQFEILAADAGQTATRSSGFANAVCKLIDDPDLDWDSGVRARIAAANGQAVIVRRRPLTDEATQCLPRLAGAVLHGGVASLEIRGADGEVKALLVSRAAAARAGCDRNVGGAATHWRRILEDDGRVHMSLSEADLAAPLDPSA